MRTRHHSGSPFESRYGFCRAVRMASWIFVAGTAPLDAAGKTVSGGAYEQARRCFEIACNALAELGGKPEHVLRTRMFVTDPADADEIGRAHAEFFGAAPPAATMVVVAGLLDPAWRVEIEVDAECGTDTI